MLWYLLSPLRGTTDPPQLSADHPIRRAFYRHGKTTARHWLLAMLASVAIAMAFSYPTILSAENPTAGYASLPHRVWTTARPFDGDPAHTDVEMRQVWIHGSHMKALDKAVLKGALEIQQILVGPNGALDTFASLDQNLRAGRLSRGYHSPLMYWNNSAETIDADVDILRTINEQARRSSSSMNVALRPASVFAGKQFDRQKLTAADALVITLMNAADDGVGDQWKTRMASLKANVCEHCTLFPRDGEVSHNLAYELRFTPLSANEHLALTVAYSCMAIYVLLALRRIKAFHSRFGLVVTAITQMMCSILASCTICGLLKINLAMIPQNVYPFVVLVIGLENVFRIINAVLAYPPTMSTELRIANALGDVGPVSVATAAQNIVILAVLSRLVSPGVAAFCAFACIATIFDVFFLLTFFVAVLNVDIRRFELQDALARANQLKHRRRPTPTHTHSWFDALVHGRLPFSTRMAGTVVTVMFIVSLNYHFFEHEGSSTGFLRLLGLNTDGPPQLVEFETLASGPINVSLTPSQWMRMQDFDTAKEVLRLAKPGADSVVVRVFSPLLVALPGSDRTAIEVDQSWSLALHSFALVHFYPVTVAVIFIVAFVFVLMNYLLYSEVNESNGEREEEEELAVRSIALPHKLDIVKLARSDKGHFISVGLDRTIAVSRFDRAQQLHSALALPPELLSAIYWPVYEAAIDDSGEWAAIQGANDQVLVFGCKSDSMTVKHLQYSDENPPILFGFFNLQPPSSNSLHFLVLTSGAQLTALSIETRESVSIQLTQVRLLGAAVLEGPSQSRRLVIVTANADLVSFTWNGDTWGPGNHQHLPVRTRHGRLTGTVRIEQHAESGTDFIAITTSREVVFMDTQALTVLGVLRAADDETVYTDVMLGPVTKCEACGRLAFRCLAVVRNSPSDETECSTSTLWASGDAENAGICVRPESPACLSFETAQRTEHTVSNPGAWSAITAQAILGLRRQETPPSPRGAAKPGMLSLRHRRSARSVARRSKKDPSASDDAGWEAYKLSLDGDLATRDVSATTGESEDEKSLYVSRAGPAVPLDSQSVAIAFGNSVKIIRATRRGSVTVRKTR